MDIKFPAQQWREKGPLFSGKLEAGRHVSYGHDGRICSCTREQSWKCNKGRNIASQMNASQHLIPADPSQHKENITEEGHLLQLPLALNLNTQPCTMSFWVYTTEETTSSTSGFLHEKDSNNCTSNINVPRSSSVRSRKEKPFPEAEVSLVLVYSESTLRHSG